MLRVGKRLWWIEVLLEPRDCWVGLFWVHKPARYASAYGEVTEELHVYVCVVPCVPVHVVFGKAVPHA